MSLDSTISLLQTFIQRHLDDAAECTRRIAEIQDELDQPMSEDRYWRTERALNVEHEKRAYHERVAARDAATVGILKSRMKESA